VLYKTCLHCSVMPFIAGDVDNLVCKLFGKAYTPLPRLHNVTYASLFVFEVVYSCAVDCRVRFCLCQLVVTKSTWWNVVLSCRHLHGDYNIALACQVASHALMHTDQESFRGGMAPRRRWNSVPIVKALKNALSTALRTIFRPKMWPDCKILHYTISKFSGRGRGSGSGTIPLGSPAFPLFHFYETTSDAWQVCELMEYGGDWLAL